MHKGQRRLQKLLCRTPGVASASNGKSPVRKWVSPDNARRRCRSSEIVANSADDFCKLHERSFPPRCPAGIYSSGFRDDAELFTTYISDSYQAQRAIAKRRRAD